MLSINIQCVEERRAYQPKSTMKKTLMYGGVGGTCVFFATSGYFFMKNKLDDIKEKTEKNNYDVYECLHIMVLKALERIDQNQESMEIVVYDIVHDIVTDIVSDFKDIDDDYNRISEFAHKLFNKENQYN